MSRAGLFVFVFLLVWALLFAIFVDAHERTHRQIARYFGYPSDVPSFTSEGVSTPTYVPASDLNTPKYWAYLAAQSSVEAVGYQLFPFLPFFALILTSALFYFRDHVL